MAPGLGTRMGRDAPWGVEAGGEKWEQGTECAGHAHSHAQVGGSKSILMLPFPEYNSTLTLPGLLQSARLCKEKLQ